MAKTVEPSVRSGATAAVAAEPLLEPGDRLSRVEFERRYERMPHLKKAELIEGIVYMPSPIRVNRHAIPHSHLAGWLVLYTAETPGVECADNPTVRLDLDNEPQPDLVLMKLPARGGQARVSPDDYLEGPPELVVEIVGSSSAYDLHQKKNVYRRNGILEYLVWITGEQRLIWWELRDEEYQEIAPTSEGLLESRAFSGLRLDVPALLRGDMKAVLATLRRGLASVQRGGGSDLPAPL
jgi:Uma2 family endonuclease